MKSTEVGGILTYQSIYPVRTLVVGAGAGAFAALSLAEAGAKVTLADRGPGILTGASSRTGRRLHLGEHYSADVLPAHDLHSLNTGRLCFLGALAMVRRFPFLWSPTAAWWQLLPENSMTTPEQYEEHLASLRAFHRELARVDPAVDTLLGKADSRHQPLDLEQVRGIVSCRKVAAAFITRESVIDLSRLRKALNYRLHTARPQVNVRMRTEVISINPRSSGYRVTMQTPAGKRQERDFELIVNATWHEIPFLSDIVAPGYHHNQSVRLKLIVTSRIPEPLRSLPSCYFHRGIYGNHTNVGSTFAIITAESISNLSFAHIEKVPASWQAVLGAKKTDTRFIDYLKEIDDAAPTDAGSTGDDRAQQALRAAVSTGLSAVSTGEAARIARVFLARSVIETYGELLPAFRGVIPTGLQFSTVLAEGRADLHNPRSPVHTRAFQINEVAPGFYNFNPGKLTLAQVAADYLCMACNLPTRRPGIASASITDDILKEFTRHQGRMPAGQ
jgi:glycine/D-amino acid oxidase-like deaminating enzyme